MSLPDSTEDLAAAHNREEEGDDTTDSLVAGYSRRTDVWVRPGTATAVSRIPRDLFHPKGPAPK